MPSTWRLCCPLPPERPGWSSAGRYFLGYQVLLPYTILGQWQEDDLTAALVSLAPITAFLAVTLVRRLGRRPE